MNQQAPTDKTGGRERLLLLTALAASLLIGVQLCLIAWQGEAACLNEGCRVVEGLTRVSPLLFNLFGLLFFLVVGLTTALRRTWPAAERLTALLLLAAMAGEGVLLAYQYHVAREWCSYCLIIFCLVTLCNLLLGLRQVITGTMLVVAVNVAFALLRFEPVQTGKNIGLAAGTAAVRPGPAGARSVALVYANDCPHCMALLRKLPEFAACTIRLNPVGDPPPAAIPDLERINVFQPELNRQLLRLLQIDAVPILLVPENGGYQVIRSQTGIESFLQAHCTEPETSQPASPGQNVPETSPLPAEQSPPPSATDKECGVEVECGEPATPFFQQFEGSRAK